MAQVILWLFIALVMYLWGAALFGQKIGQFLKRRREAIEAQTSEVTGTELDPTAGRGSDVFGRRP
jgi:hypothetical protein